MKLRTSAMILLLAAVVLAATPALAQTPILEIKTGQVFFNPNASGVLKMNADSGSGAAAFGEFTFTEDGSNEWSFGRFANGNQFYVFNYLSGQYGIIIEADHDVGFNCFSGADDLTIGSGLNGCKSGTHSTINAGSTQFTASSSRTIKENLEPLEVPDLLDKIAATEVYNYDFIDGQKDAIGIMAEDFHQIFNRGSDKMLSGHEMQVALWLAVQELTEQNRALAAQNDELTGRLAALETTLGRN